MDANFQTTLETFVSGAQQLVNADYAERLPEYDVPTFSIEIRRNFAFIILNMSHGMRHGWGLVALKDICTKEFTFRKGDVIHARKWDKPSKTVRGNIFDNTGLDHVKTYGPTYL